MIQTPMTVILGPTATGKTRIAALAAEKCGAEIISADSRQVYRGMDLGTGKDTDDYTVNGKLVPHHLIDIADAGSQYNIFDYRRDFQSVCEAIVKRGNPIMVCGGSGMYLETALGLYDLKEAPLDKLFRKQAADMTHEALIEMLMSLSPLHNTTDTTDRERLIRAIEVAKAGNADGDETERQNRIIAANRNLIFGVSFPRDEIRARITQRLYNRLRDGMLNEVQELLNKGILPESLMYYGLEYRYLTMHLTGELSFDDMFRQLNTAIHQFAKRQMTWFRRMESRGLNIRWLDGNAGPEANAAIIAGAVLFHGN